jgi:hypothetical protein
MQKNFGGFWERQGDVSENIKSCRDFIALLTIQSRFQLSIEQEKYK